MSDGPRYTGKEMRAIVAAVDGETPKPADVAAYAQLLKDMPLAWRMAGDMARNTQQILLDNLTKQHAVSAAVTTGMATLRRELGYDTSPMLEQLLIEQVVLCWLQVYETHYRHAYTMADNPSFERGMYWERRLTAAQTRYLRATETLARVRRLGKVTPLQVNIGAQQVNVAGKPARDCHSTQDDRRRSTPG